MRAVKGEGVEILAAAFGIVGLPAAEDCDVDSQRVSPEASLFRGTVKTGARRVLTFGITVGGLAVDRDMCCGLLDDVSEDSAGQQRI